MKHLYNRKWLMIWSKRFSTSLGLYIWICVTYLEFYISAIKVLNGNIHKLLFLLFMCGWIRWFYQFRRIFCFVVIYLSASLYTSKTTIRSCKHYNFFKLLTVDFGFNSSLHHFTSLAILNILLCQCFFIGIQILRLIVLWISACSLVLFRFLFSTHDINNW